MTETSPWWQGKAVAPKLRRDLSALPPYRAGARPTAAPGIDRVYSLASNESPVPPLPAARRAFADAVETANRYPDPASRKLITALAKHLAVPEQGITVGTGSVALCQQAVAAAAGPGDEVVFAWRSFEAYPIITGVAGARSVPVPLTAQARHDLPAMATAVGERTRVVFLCSPNNPTGPLLRQAEVDTFLDSIRDDVLVVIDEAYFEYVTDPTAVNGVATAQQRGNVIALRTFSKAYGLAGLRVGYAVGPPALLDCMRQVALPFGVSSPAQAAAAASLGSARDLAERVDATIAERVRVATRLRDLGYDVPDTSGNFVWLPLGERAQAFAQACQAVGVTVRAFGGEGVRVSVAEPEANDRVLGVASQMAGTFGAGA